MGVSRVGVAFGRVLRDCRTRKGQSQQELALRADLDRTYVSLLVRRLQQPTLTTLFTLVRKLDVSAATLVSRTAAAADRYMAYEGDEPHGQSLGAKIRRCWSHPQIAICDPIESACTVSMH